jgi:hypothetical protein
VWPRLVAVIESSSPHRNLWEHQVPEQQSSQKNTAQAVRGRGSGTCYNTERASRAQLPITAPGGASACIVPMLLAAKAGRPRGSRRLEHVRVHVPHDGTLLGCAPTSFRDLRFFLIFFKKIIFDNFILLSIK